MSATRSILNPGHRHLLGFVFVSLALHLIWFGWYALHGVALFAPAPGVGAGGGGDDIVFQLSRGDSGGPEQELAGSELDFQEALPRTLAEDAIEAPELEEDEAAVPVAPAEADINQPAAKTTTSGAAGATEQAGKKQAGGDGGDADRTRRSRAGTALTGPQITSAFTGRTLHLTAGRLDIPGGNRLMDVKMHLFPDGTTRVELVYFHYKTFHDLKTSTRRLKGDGTWWIEADTICFRAMIINYGASECYEMNQRPTGDLDLYFTNCTKRSSSHCEPMRLGATGTLKSGID